MKHTLRAALAICLTAAVIVVACKKSNNSTTGPTLSLNQLFAGLRTSPQNLSVAAGRDTIVYGANGTMLHFYTNSFKDASGNIITSGTVNLQLIEMYKPGDMIANRATTTANDTPLISGGQVKILAFMGAQQLYANKYGIGFKQSAASAQQMELFYGGVGNTDSVTTWTAGNNTTGMVATHTTTDSTHLPVGIRYVFDSCTSFNFVNCDHPFTSGSKKIYSKLIFSDTSFSTKNTQVFVCFPSFNCVVANSSNWWGNNVSGIIDGGFFAPIGTNYKLVVMSYKTGGDYYYETSGVVSDSLIVSPAMVSETQTDIIARLSGL